MKVLTNINESKKQNYKVNLQGNLNYKYPNMVDSWSPFISNSTSSVTCADHLHRQLGTHKLVRWNCGKER